MKERIVITQDWLVKDMKAGVPELDKLFICQKVEKVPESWEELKNLCSKNNLEILADIIYTNALSFHKNGDIKDNENSIVAENRTPAQMWQIIKNLMGEE